jgi:hypothetical protein
MDKTKCSTRLNQAINKKIRCVFILLIALNFIYVDGKANQSRYRKSRYNESITIGISGGLMQVKMLNFETSFEQKFLESAMGITLGKYYKNGLKMEATYIYNFSKIGPFFDNSENNLKYIRIHKSRMYLLTGSYDFYLDPKNFISPKFGVGRMYYKEQYNGSLDESFNRNKITELVKIGLDYNFAFNDRLSAHVGGEYLIGKKHHQIPMLHIGLTYFIPYTTLKKIARNCPSFF